MTTEQLIQRIRSLTSEKYHIGDHIYSRRHIYNKLITARARLIYQEANKKKDISQWNYQTLPCVELILVPGHQCPCLPPIGCEILRSRYKLPKPITSLFGTLISSVQTVDRSVKLNEVTINAVNYLRGNKYSKNILAYFIQDNYLYVVSNTSLRVVSITGLFEDPLEATNFPNMCDEDCVDCKDCIDFRTEIFPIDNNLIDALIELTIQELILKRQIDGKEQAQQ